jgi:hypothetical protein
MSSLADDQANEVQLICACLSSPIFSRKSSGSDAYVYSGRSQHVCFLVVSRCTKSYSLLKVLGDGLMTTLRAVPDVTRAVTTVAPALAQWHH